MVQYRRVEVEWCIRRVAAEGFAEVFSRRGTADEGGGTRRYRRADIEEAIKIEGFAEGGGTRRYRRADIEEAIKVEGFAEGGGQV